MDRHPETPLGGLRPSGMETEMKEYTLCKTIPN